MKAATYRDKDRIIDLLTRSFDTNKSVNYVIKQDHKRKERIRNLMDYSFEICFRYGKVYLNEQNNACALILFPDKKSQA